MDITDQLRQQAAIMAANGRGGEYLDKAAAELDRLRARVAELEGAWLPIETAPKDGETAVLGYQKIPGGLWVIAPMYWKDGEWLILAFHTANTEYEMRPTHWRPIPDAPNVTSAALASKESAPGTPEEESCQ